MRTLVSPSDCKKMLYNAWKIESSEAFFACFNIQLSAYFEQKTGIEIVPKVRFALVPGNSLIYTIGPVSKIESCIFLPYGMCDVSCRWQSKSGRIYSIADTDINCADIEFWMEGLDAAYCRDHMKPRRTLFGFHEQWQLHNATNTKLEVSDAFIACADVQLTPLFEKIVGYKANAHTSLMLSSISGQHLLYEDGPISKLAVTFYNNHNWNYAYLYWQSKSGRIYNVADTDIDCNDISFWFEGIDAALFQRQMYPKDKLPFKLKNLSYELVVTRLNTDCNIHATLRQEAIERGEAIGKELIDFVEDFNQKSEAKDRKDGVVHSTHAMVADGNVLELTLDIGSVGAAFFKKLLTLMSAMGNFEKVNIN
jgi:hypothetical protein